MNFKEITKATTEVEILAAQTKTTTGVKDLSQLCTYWAFIKKFLLIAKFFTGPQGDKKIDEIISWGDAICPGN